MPIDIGFVVSPLKLNLAERSKFIPVSLSFELSLVLGLPLTTSVAD
jgi:hypothetical protein